MSKPTAVEWLEAELKKLPMVNVTEVFQQAKAMEKEQIIDAFKHGELPPLFVNLNAEEYYNETYGGDK